MIAVHSSPNPSLFFLPMLLFGCVAVPEGGNTPESTSDKALTTAQRNSIHTAFVGAFQEAGSSFALRTIDLQASADVASDLTDKLTREIAAEARSRRGTERRFFCPVFEEAVTTVSDARTGYPLVKKSFMDGVNTVLASYSALDQLPSVEELLDANSGDSNFTFFTSRNRTDVNDGKSPSAKLIEGVSIHYSGNVVAQNVMFDLCYSEMLEEKSGCPAAAGSSN